jgi:hypothetical protein
MIDDISPQIGLFIVLLIFVILWYFYGGSNDYAFVGLKPLYPEYELGEETTLETHSTKTIQESCFVEPQDDIDSLLPEKITDVNFTIDLTPQLPDIFTEDIVYEKKEGGRFTSKGETICKQTLEKIYGVPFTNQRLNILKNPETGRNLEIDCYNADLRIGCEYNGKAHFAWGGPNSMMSYDNFRKQVKRDLLKKKLCAEHNIHLIIVPHNVKFSMIPLYIVYHLPELIRQRALDEKIIESL